MTTTTVDPVLALAVLDAMFYAQAAIEQIRRDVEIGGVGRHVFDKAGRGAEMERQPARPVNAAFADAFLQALGDYGYDVVPARAGEAA